MKKIPKGWHNPPQPFDNNVIPSGFRLESDGFAIIIPSLRDWENTKRQLHKNCQRTKTISKGEPSCFNRIEKTFNRIANNFGQILQGFNQVLNKFNQVLNEFNQVLNKFNQVLNKFNQILNEFNQVLNALSHVLNRFYGFWQFFSQIWCAAAQNGCVLCGTSAVFSQHYHAACRSRRTFKRDDGNYGNVYFMQESEEKMNR